MEKWPRNKETALQFYNRELDYLRDKLIGKRNEITGLLFDDEELKDIEEIFDRLGIVQVQMEIEGAANGSAANEDAMDISSDGDRESLAGGASAVPVGNEINGSANSSMDLTLCAGQLFKSGGSGASSEAEIENVDDGESTVTVTSLIADGHRMSLEIGASPALDCIGTSANHRRAKIAVGRSPVLDSISGDTPFEENVNVSNLLIHILIAAMR